MFHHQGRCLLAAIVCVSMAGGVWAQSANNSSPAPLTSEQIVEQLRQHNQTRTEQLRQYKSLRHYQVEYKGFPAAVAATMDVEVSFDASSGKNLRIVSQTGPKFLCDKVLKRAVESESEAAKDKGASALTQANYTFHLAGSENLAGRPAYILDVEPVTGSKFLYRGKIWVDAADFAVVKIDAQPAKNPSFWISRTQIRFSNARLGGFWLPEQNRSESKVRLGGTAVLTIDYGTYQFPPDVSRARASN